MLAELVRIRVTDHYIGESGKNKTTLDSHFGVKGSQASSPLYIAPKPAIIQPATTCTHPATVCTQPATICISWLKSVLAPLAGRLIAAALKDIITPDDLFEGVKMTLGRNEAVQQYMPVRARGSDLDTKSISHLTAMSHRTFDYNPNGEFVGLVLRQQTALGAGLRVAASELRKPEAQTFAPPRLLASAGATSNSGAGVTSSSAAAQAQESARGKAPSANGGACGGACGVAGGAARGEQGGAQGGAAGSAVGGAARGAARGAEGGTEGGAAGGAEGSAARGAAGGAEGDTEGGAAGGAAGVGKPSVAEAPLPVARDRKGRELAESWRAQRRLVRRAQAQQKEAAQMAAELARCQQSKCLWCRCDTRGSPYCNFTAASAVELDAHLKANKHSEGKLAPFKTGVAAGRGAASDRDAAVIKKVLTAGASSSSHRLETNETLKQTDGFALTYGDGRQYEQAAPADGWARAQRLPTVHSTPAQLEFVYYAFTIGEAFTNVKFLPVEAQQLMAKVGTAEIAGPFPITRTSASSCPSRASRARRCSRTTRSRPTSVRVRSSSSGCTRTRRRGAPWRRTTGSTAKTMTGCRAQRRSGARGRAAAAAAGGRRATRWRQRMR